MPSETLDLMRDSSKEFPVVSDPEEVVKLRIWHCKYRTLRSIASFKSLKELVIGSYPDATLDPLAGLQSLKWVSILHAPKVKSISPLGNLRMLEVLSLATSPSWDASGRVSEIQSLDPLLKLVHLQHLELLGVCTADRSLEILKQCRSLKSLRVSQYPKDEVGRFYAETGVRNEFNPKSSFGA